MRHTLFGDVNHPKSLALLVTSLHAGQMERHYLKPYGIDPDFVLGIELYQDPVKKKTARGVIKEWCEQELMEVLGEQGIKYAVVTQSEYFKVLTGQEKSDANVGYIMPCVMEPSIMLVYAPAHQQVFHDPEKTTAKINSAIKSIADHASGCYKPPGDSIVHFEEYPRTYGDIQTWLQRLIDEDRPLTCDIEAFSLKHNTAGIGTITFCWSKHEGISFPVDYVEKIEEEDGFFGEQGYNAPMRELLVWFFTNFKQKVIYHNIAYDAYVLIYQLFMKDIIDTKGLLAGLKVMLKDWDDTKLISYLATNTCAGNELGLKVLAQEHAGNWAESDIVDIRRIPLDKLLRYNLIDGLSTWFVHEKYEPMMIADQQQDLYEGLFKGSTKDIIQMQLTGMPINIKRVAKVKSLLQVDYDNAVNRISQCKLVQEYQYQRMEDWVTKKNSEWKKKRADMAMAKVEALKPKSDINWNPNSYPQIQELIYDRIGLPTIEYTKNKQPSVGGDTLKKLKNHTNDPEVLALLDALLDYTAVNKILTGFIPAMESAVLGPDGWHYLFGKFNLGGTVSGRLSSSDPL